MKIVERLEKGMDKYAPPGSWLYRWRTKSHYILWVIAAILVVGLFAKYGIGPFA